MPQAFPMRLFGDRAVTCRVLPHPCQAPQARLEAAALYAVPSLARAGGFGQVTVK